MAFRDMIDMTHVNVATVKDLHLAPDLVAGYGTGSADVIWTAGDWSQWPGIPHVIIDQGFTGSVLPHATVRDVEAGAWTPAAAVNRDGWNAERPTIYCNRSTLPQVINAGWRGDVWLAIPGFDSDVAPQYPGVKVVAVQDLTYDSYDRSMVFDPDWPYAAKKEAKMIHFRLNQGGDAFVPFPPGSFGKIILYRDFLSAQDEMSVRIAYRSALHGYTVEVVRLNSPVPVTVNFRYPDVDAVSLVNNSGAYYSGVTLA